MDNSVQINYIKESLKDSTLFYVICVGMDEKYSYVNPNYARSFQYIAAEFVGQHYSIDMHPDDTKICSEVSVKCFTHVGMPFPAIIRKHDGQGGFISTEWEFTLMVTNGEPVGIICLGYDITEFVRTKSNNVIVNKDLKSKIELLGAIAFEQSHLVSAPLSRIQSLVSILKEMDMGPNAAAVNATINMLEENSNQLQEIIESIIIKSGL
jgi:PAS domain S-box-containing protein